ncbi:ATP-binding protein [bacterium]|nr:ATP-binding protein [bacterium]
MLLEFSVTNYMSFKKKQTLSMVASSKTERLEENTIETRLDKLPRVLRSAVVYGPNAGGKSNLLRAIKFMREGVLRSSKESQADDEISTIPFLFDSKTSAEPSEFEIQFIKDEVRYQYGFSVTKERVMSEWLLAYPKGRPQLWFDRKYDKSGNKYKYEYSTFFKGLRKVWEESTRENALFLSTAVQLNNEQLKPVYQWFADIFIETTGIEISKDFSAKVSQTAEGKKQLLHFLKKADESIEDIEVKEESIKSEHFADDVPSEVKKRLLDQKMWDVYFIHQRSDDKKPIPINYSFESDGTRRLFSIAGPLADVLSMNRILFIDELNKSMHPLMTRFLLEQFQNPKNNESKAQLIFTTHDTSLLDTNIMRRDQIWFVEKNKENATELYPLSDFKPRKETSLEKGYLKGRFGALPFIAEEEI